MANGYDPVGRTTLPSTCTDARSIVGSYTIKRQHSDVKCMAGHIPSPKLSRLPIDADKVLLPGTMGVARTAEAARRREEKMVAKLTMVI